MATSDTTTATRKRSRSLIRTIFILCILMAFWPALFGIYYGAYHLYTAMDPTTFPTPDATVTQVVQQASQVTGDGAEPAKGAALMDSLGAQLKRELDSPFGWSVNDLAVMPTSWLDNRANRQKGVIFATRMLARFYATNLAKLGQADPENEELKECREKRLVYGEDVWGFFRPSAENEYEKALGLMEKYKTDLAAGEAVFNARTDDIYNALVFVNGEEFLGNTLGMLLQTNEEVDYFDLDDRIYYAQGVVLVVRDFLHALVGLYPDITDKGGEDNVRIAFRDMDRICTFDPLIVLRGNRDSLLADHRGKLARYLITVQKRIDDLAQSVRR